MDYWTPTETIAETKYHAHFVKRHTGVLVGTFFVAVFAGVFWGFVAVAALFVSCQGLHP